jgi:hypothetical protein
MWSAIGIEHDGRDVFADDRPSSFIRRMADRRTPHRPDDFTVRCSPPSAP